MSCTLLKKVDLSPLVTLQPKACKSRSRKPTLVSAEATTLSSTKKHSHSNSLLGAFEPKMGAPS